MHRDLFVTLCMKMFVGLSQLDDELSKEHCAEIERLFVRQMFFENVLDRDDYIRALGALSSYFARLVRCKETSMCAVSKLLVSLIEHHILTLTLIHSVLSEAQCVISNDICYEVIKYLMHSASGNSQKIDGLIGEMKRLRFGGDVTPDFEPIFRSLNIDYSLFAH